MALPTDTPAPSPEDLEKIQNSMIEHMFPTGDSLAVKRSKEAEAERKKQEEEAKKNQPAPGTPPPTPPAEKPPETPPVETPPAQPPATPPATPPTPSAPVVVPPPPVAPKADKPAEPPPAPQQFELNEKEKKTIAVMKRMGEGDPKYKTLADDTVKFLKMEQDYIAQWQEKNPGSKFDADAEDHATFYENNQPTFEEDDYVDAKDDMRFDKLEQKTSRTVSAKQNEVESRSKMKEAEPEVRGLAAGLVHSMIAQAVPEFAEHMKVDGRVVMTKEQEQKIKTEAPDIHEVLIEGAERTNILVVEFERLNRFSDTYKPNENMKVKLSNGDTIHPHREITEMMIQIEDEMLAKKPEEVARDGKRLISHSQWMEWIESLDKTNPSDQQRNAALTDFQSKYYILQHQDFRDQIVSKQVEKVQRHVNRLKKHIKLPSLKLGENPPKPGESNPPPNTPPAQTPPANNKPPSISSSSETMDVTKTGVHTGPTEVDKAVSVAFPAPR